MHNNNQRIIIDLSVTLRVECRMKYFCFNCQIKGINQSTVQTFIPSIDDTIDFIAYAFDLFNHSQDELVMSNRLEISRSWGLSKCDGVRGGKRGKPTSSLSAGKAANGSSTFSFITCSSSWKPHVVKNWEWTTWRWTTNSHSKIYQTNTKYIYMMNCYYIRSWWS